MFIAGPDVQPNSAEKAFDSTATSSTAPIGTVAIIVCRPQPSSLLAPSSMKVVVRRLPDAVMKYVALTNRSPVPLPWRKAELNSGRVVILRPRIGVSSICGLSRRRPICGSARTPSAVPYTVTSAFAAPTSRRTLSVAVSPERSEMSVRSSAPKPSFVTVTL